MSCIRTSGFVAFELRTFLDCIKYLEAGPKSTERPLPGELRQTIEWLLIRARALIAHAHLTITPRPETVLVDGVPTEC